MSQLEGFASSVVSNFTNQSSMVIKTNKNLTPDNDKTKMVAGLYSWLQLMHSSSCACYDYAQLATTMHSSTGLLPTCCDAIDSN